MWEYVRPSIRRPGVESATCTVLVRMHRILLQAGTRMRRTPTYPWALAEQRQATADSRLQVGLQTPSAAWLPVTTHQDIQSVLIHGISGFRKKA